MVKKFQAGTLVNMFFGSFDSSTTVRMEEKGSLFPEKCWFLAKICLIWKLKEYTSDHRPNAPAIRMF